MDAQHKAGLDFQFASFAVKPRHQFVVQPLAFPAVSGGI
jgi:hypothetical protein